MRREKNIYFQISHTNSLPNNKIMYSGNSKLTLDLVEQKDGNDLNHQWI